MPGIVGIISKSPQRENVERLRIMIHRMNHEPFYITGTYINERLGLYAGWVSHKGSFSDCMPIFNEKKTSILVFTGEIFVDNDVTDQLKKQHHDFNSLTASYLVHLYEEKGVSFLPELNGQFSGVLLDSSAERMLLFNDRYGMQRLYYYEGKDLFLFSSEAKSILEVCPDLREIDEQGLSEFFSCGCVLQNRTIFSKIYLLPGASAWEFGVDNKPKKDSYCVSSAWENQAVLKKETYYERLRDTFLSVLPRYFRSSQPIALSLTGGLDTRIILACRDNPPGTLPCYTFAGMYRDSFDVRVARRVADACHQTHQVLRLDSNFLRDFPCLAEKAVYISDGCIDLSGAPELYLNRLAREIAPIRLTGNYGGEVLRKVGSFKAIYLCEKLFQPDFFQHIIEAGTTLTRLSSGDHLSVTLFKQLPWYGYGRLAVEQSQLTLRTPFMDNDLINLVYRSSEESDHNNEISLRLIADGNRALASMMTDRGVSGKSRVPFSILARLFHEFLFKAEYCYDYGMPQWLAVLNHALGPLHLERQFLGRHKFYHLNIWFQNELSEYVKEILFDRKTATRAYLNNKFLKEMIEGHIAGRRNYTNEINKILTVELIHRLFIERL